MAASITIWGTIVTPLQFFGYGIALCGLVYYKLGAGKFLETFQRGQRSWSEFGNRSPALKRLLVFGLIIFIVFIGLGGFGYQQGYGADMKPENLADRLKEQVKEQMSRFGG